MNNLDYPSYNGYDDELMPDWAWQDEQSPEMARREYNHLIRDLCAYANIEHEGYFQRVVTPQMLKRWIDRGLCDASEVSIDEAVRLHKIPPRRGRPKKQDAPEYIRIADIVHIPFVETLIEELAEIGEEAG